MPKVVSCRPIGLYRSYRLIGVNVTASTSIINLEYEIIKCIFVDYEDDEWPEDLGKSASGVTAGSRLASAAVSGSAAVAASETDVQTVKRLNALRRTEAVIANIGAMLAGIVVGFDVRSNVSKATPDSLDGLSAAKFRLVTEDSRDLIPAVGQRHTYHGCHTRYRPTVNFNLPIRYAESSYDEYCSNRDCFMTPCSEQPTTSSADSRRTTPSLSARSFFSAESSCQSPTSRKQSVVDSTSSGDLALISLSPSTDEAFVEYQRQFFDTGWAVIDTSTWTPKSTPKCDGLNSENIACVQTTVTAANSHQSPTLSSYCLASDAIGAPCSSDTDTDAGSQCPAGIPNALCPPPMLRRPLNHEHVLAERPVTLDIIPRPRPLPGILKNVSPVHVTPYSSPRSRVTPSSDGGTSHTQSPYHVVNNQFRVSLSADHRKTLLDIDAEGQTADSTKPLSVTQFGREPDIIL